MDFASPSTFETRQGQASLSQFHYQQSIKNEPQDYNSITLPDWGTCDPDLSNYSPLFEDPSSLDSTLYNSNFDPAEQWKFYNTDSELFPDEIPASSLIQTDFPELECVSPGSSYSETISSGFNSPTMFNSAQMFETHAHDSYTWDTNKQELKTDRHGTNRQSSIKPRWSSCQPKQKLSEPCSKTRSKRGKGSTNKNSAPPKEAVEPPTSRASARISSARCNDSQSTPQSKGRKDHNLIEKKYRSKLNGQFETLLATLPAELVAEVNEARIAAKQPEKAISKAEVLTLAKEHIENLERRMEELEREGRHLNGEVGHLNRTLLSSEGEVTT